MASPFSAEEIALREELRGDVETLAVEIGERNMLHYAQLNAAADFIENSLSTPVCDCDATLMNYTARIVTISKRKFAVFLKKLS